MLRDLMEHKCALLEIVTCVCIFIHSKKNSDTQLLCFNLNVFCTFF